MDLEKLSWIASVGEPISLVALLLGGGLPLLLLPSPIGQLLAVMAMAAVLGFNYYVDHSTKHLPIRTGADAVRGRIAVVAESLTPKGMVRCDGEVWRAVEANGRWVSPGEQVLVVGIQGLELRVIRQKRGRE